MLVPTVWHSSGPAVRVVLLPPRPQWYTRNGNGLLMTAIDRGAYHDIMRPDDQDARDTWAAASLRVISETMEVETIAAVLGLKPDDSWQKGTPSSARNPQSALRTHNGWVRTSGLDSDEPLLSHLDALFAELEPRADQLEQLTAQCMLDLYCGYGPGNHAGHTTLDHTWLQWLARLPLSLTFDFSGPNWDVPLIDIDTVRAKERAGYRLTPPRRWQSGALAIRSASLSAAEASSLLGLAARWPASELEQFSALISEHPTWVRESGLPRSAVLEDHLDALLTLGEAQAQAFQRVRERAAIEVRLCYASDWGQGGFGCEHATVKRLSALPFDLTIELTYPPQS